MNWEEKIDLLKTKFSPTDFKDHFLDWSNILRKIEAKFIIRDSSKYQFTNWSDNLKSKSTISTISHHEINDQLNKLDINVSYWVVIQAQNNPTAKHFIYECRPNSLELLISITSGDFYIIDKKYQWLTFFKIDYDNSRLEIFKSGSEHTPFDVC